MPRYQQKRITIIPHNHRASFCTRIFHAITFVPLGLIFLERLYLPFEFGNLAGYLDVENAAVTHAIKNPMIGEHDAPPLAKLTGSYSWKKMCSTETTLLADVQLPGEEVLGMGHIPKIIHQTGKTRCVTPAFSKLTAKWKLPGYSYYFHDDDAVNRLLEMDFPEFPHLRAVLRNCVTNGTIKADLWRYLILWVYGGVYADFDSAPNELDIETIRAEYDGLFVVEQYHILSQWFMAVCPKHPLMFYAIQHSLLNLLEAEDTKKIGAHVKTGPHALHKAFIDFRKDVGVLVDPLGVGLKPVWQGTFPGTGNHTITVLGVGEEENQYVRRMAIPPAVRKRDYSTMGMTHFSKYTQPNAPASGKTCSDAILDDINSAISKNTPQ